MGVVVVQPLQLKVKIYSSPGLPDAATVTRPNLINYVYDPTKARIAGASMSVSGGGTVVYQTVEPSKGAGQVARIDSPEVIARHPDNTAPVVAATRDSPYYPADPFGQDQMVATNYNAFVRSKVTQING